MHSFGFKYFIWLPLVLVASACKSTGDPSSEALIIGGQEGANLDKMGIVPINNGQVHCTGTFVTPELVITSATCSGTGRFAHMDEFKTLRVESHAYNVSAVPSSLKQFGVGVFKSKKASSNVRPLNLNGGQLTAGASIKIVGYGCLQESVRQNESGLVVRQGKNKVDAVLGGGVFQFAGVLTNSPSAFADASACPPDAKNQSADEGAAILNDKDELVGIVLYSEKKGHSIVTYGLDLASPNVKNFLDKTLNYKHETGTFSSVDYRHGDVGPEIHVTVGGQRQEDWAPGFRKGTCPYGHRVIGVSKDARFLCTDTGRSLMTSGDQYTATKTANFSGKIEGDWAKGQVKAECEPGHYLAGLATAWQANGQTPSAGVCLKTPQSASLGVKSCHTVWFQDRDNRPDLADGGDFASRSFKGQCANDEYVRGFSVMYLTTGGHGYHSSIRCCKM